MACRAETFNVRENLGGMGVGLKELLRCANGIVKGGATGGVACFLPRNVDLEQVSGELCLLARSSESVVVFCCLGC